MKVVDVNPYYYPLFGGIEHRMHLIAKEMVARGHEVTIVTGQLEGTELEEDFPEGYHVIRLSSWFLKIYNPPYISSKGLLDTLNSLDADIVNFNYRWAPSYTKDMRHYAGKKVFTYHNMWGEGVGLVHYASEFNDNRFRKTLDTFDHIIAVSDFVRDDLIKRGIPPERVDVATPFLETFPEVSHEEGDYILSLGRLVRTKGLDYMIKAMKDVDSKMILCGKGPDFKRLEKAIKRYGLSDRIEMRGWVSEEEKVDLMRRCKFFVMPSIYESYGFAAMEIMSYGKPLVCTDVDGLPWTVGKGGLFVPPKDPAALADAMNKMLADEDLRHELGMLARKESEQRTVKTTVDKVEEVYRKVLES